MRKRPRSFSGGLGALVALGAVVGLIAAAPAVAARPVHLHGGGTASISQAAFNVRFDGAGTASGSFECLMAGRSSFVLPAFGLVHIMAVHVRPDAGSLRGSLAMYSGPAQLILDKGPALDVQADVWADTATQSFQLTLFGGPLPLGGVTPGIETMVKGGFSLS
jgi:hypothetical protein